MSAQSPRIAIADQEGQIRRCFDVMRELRSHIATVEEFLERVQRQQQQGYRLVSLEVDDQIRAVAGYRCQEMLFHGRVLYVDDLVTREVDRSAGYGGELFDWLVGQAREHECHSFELDSGVQRFDAHRFYLRKRMKIASHHFSLQLR